MDYLPQGEDEKDILPTDESGMAPGHTNGQARGQYSRTGQEARFDRLDESEDGVIAKS